MGIIKGHTVLGLYVRKSDGTRQITATVKAGLQCIQNANFCGATNVLMLAAVDSKNNRPNNNPIPTHEAATDTIDSIQLCYSDVSCDLSSD